MNKLLTKFVLAFTLSAMNFTAVAGSFDNALSGLTTVNKAGVYSGPAGGTLSFGGVTVSGGGPPQGVQLFSLTPPRMQTVGCMGIDAFLGGFDFIGGEQIKQLFENITAMAPGFVIHLVLKKLCPQCEDIVQAMEELAQAATQFNMDACNVMTKLQEKIPAAEENVQIAQMFEKGIRSSTDFLKGDCVKFAAEGEGNRGFMGSLNSVCQNAQSAYEFIDDVFERKINEATNPQDKEYLENLRIAKLCAETNTCNTTWTFVTLVQNGGYLTPKNTFTPEQTERLVSERLLFMNLLGTSTVSISAEQLAQIKSTGSTNIKTDVDRENTVHQPAIGSEAFYNMMMCGTNPTAFLNAANRSGEFTDGAGTLDYRLKIGKSLSVYCAGFYTKEATRGVQEGLIDKDAGAAPNNPLKTIADMQATEDAKLNNVANAVESYLRTKKVLTCDEDEFSACLKVVSKPLYDVPQLQIDEGYILQVYRLLYAAVIAIQTNNPIPADSLGLIQSVPFPLYQLVNLAAVYPAYAIDTLDSMTGFIADQVVQAKLNSILEYYSASGISTVMSKDFMLRYSAAISALKQANTERTTKILSSMTMQEAFIRSINTLQLSLQREVVSQDLLGNLQYSGSVTTIARNRSDLGGSGKNSTSP